MPVARDSPLGRLSTGHWQLVTGNCLLPDEEEAHGLLRSRLDCPLFLIEDRQMRIEVGYGLEGVLTDALSKRIIEDVARPFFKRDAYTEGVEASARAIMDVARGEGLAGTGRTAAEEASMFGASLRSFSINAIGFLLVISGIAIGVFICASILLLLEKTYGTGPGFSGGGSSGSWSGGVSSSSSYRSSSSSSSSSSFSGGGGRSGGGGASGSW
ncbi:MAG: TPM domain-containing protein [Thermoanaerobaculia bacterium]